MKRYICFLVGIMTLGILVSCKTNNINKGMKYNIERIEYFTSACFGVCPQFKIEIEKDRSAVFTARRFNFNKDFEAESPEGTYKGVISKEDYNLILKRLNDMDFPILKDRYQVGYTDAQTGNLKIIYDDGKEKIITDYGMQGTPELIELHKLFLDLRGSFNVEGKSLTN